MKISTHFDSCLLKTLEEVPGEGYQRRGQSTRSPGQELHVLQNKRETCALEEKVQANFR